MAEPDDTGRENEGLPAFRLGGSEPEGFGADQPVDDLRRSLFRLALVAAVVLTLLAAALAAAYVALDRRIAATNLTGTGKLERISQELSENFTRLSASVTEMKEGMQKDGRDLSARLKGLEEAQKRMADELVALRREKLGSADAKKLADQAGETAAAAVQEIEKRLQAKLSEMQKLEKSLAEAETKLAAVSQESAQAKRSLADVIEGQMSVSERAEALKKSVEALGKAKADTAFVEKLLAEQKTFYKSQMARSDKDLEQRLSALETQIVSYEAELERLRKALPQAVPGR